MRYRKQAGRSGFSAVAGLMAAGMLAIATSAAAQETPEPPEPPAPPDTPVEPALARMAQEGTETFVVTGTRIRSDNLQSPVPLQTVDAARIELTGQANAGDIIRDLPVTGVSTLLPSSSNFLVSNTGITTVELRNLTEDRTLVLVNGRRFVGGIPGTQIVDFNSIPADFIERIEVITGGASAVYGSEAMAGVINIILKDNFEGLTISGQTGQTFRESDDKRHRLSMTGGSSFGEGRGHAMFNLSYNDERGVFARDRKGQNLDCVEAPLLGFPLSDFRDCLTPFFSSFAPNSRIIGPGGQNLAIDQQTGQVRPYMTNPVGLGEPFGPDDPRDGFNRQDFRALKTPLERTLFSGVMNYNVAPSVNWFLEGTYARAKAGSIIEPFPLQSDDVFGELPFCQDTTGDDELDQCDMSSGVPLSSGTVPQELRDAILAAHPMLTEDTAVVGFARRLSEIGNRGNEVTRQTYRVVTGFEGDLLDTFSGGGMFSDLRYEASFNFGTTTSSQLSGGQLNVSNLREGFNVEPFVDPATGEDSVRCANPIARAEGCEPVFIFGENTISPEAVEYIRAPALRTARIEQLVGNAFVSGRVGQIPTGGPVGFSLGAEWREESSQDIPDALTQTGQNAGNTIKELRGRFDVVEGFAEIDVPLFVGQPFAEYFSLHAALRVADYSTVGSTTAWSAGGDWAPSHWVRFRGQYSEAIRAPNISELFSAGGETFAAVADPCNGLTIDPGSGNPAFLDDGEIVRVNSFRAQNCFADEALQERVARDGTYIPTQPELQGIGGFIGRSPPFGELKEEKGESWTIGTVLTPRSGFEWLDAFTLSVDYFNIEVTDAIQGTGRGNAVNFCYSDSELSFPDSEFCSAVRRFERGPQVGALDEVDSELRNIGFLSTQGFDAQASYGFELGNLFGGGTHLGHLLLTASYTRLLKFKTETFGQVVDDRGKAGFFSNQALYNLVYTNGPVVFNWSTQWFGKSDIDVLSVDDRGGQLPAVAFHDAQFRYKLSGRTQDTTLVFGVNNVFDKFVRLGGTNGLLTPVGSFTLPQEGFEPFGRAWYVGFRHDFN